MTIRPRAAIVGGGCPPPYGGGGCAVPRRSPAWRHSLRPQCRRPRPAPRPDRRAARPARCRGADPGGSGGRPGRPRPRPPHWPEFAAAAAFTGGPTGVVLANAALLGQACAEVGFDVVCAPVLDLRSARCARHHRRPQPGEDPAEVARLGLAVAEGLQVGGLHPRRQAHPRPWPCPWWTAIWTCRGSAVGLEELALDCAPFARAGRAGGLGDDGAYPLRRAGCGTGRRRCRRW